MTEPYWLSWAVACGVLGRACLPRHRPAPHPSRVRGGGDPTYFVAVFFWGIETSFRAFQSLHWGHYSVTPVMPWRVQAAWAAMATLMLQIAMALVSERVAGWRGHSVRTAAWSIPVPTMAAIASGFCIWLLIIGLFAAIHEPSRDDAERIDADGTRLVARIAMEHHSTIQVLAPVPEPSNVAREAHDEV